MATQMQRHHDVLHATDTALRLVNQALGDLGAADSDGSSAASIAAAAVRDGVERALAVVAELERDASESGDPVPHARYAALRETLHGVMAHLPLRNVTGRRRAHAAAPGTDATDPWDGAGVSFGPR